MQILFDIGASRMRIGGSRDGSEIEDFVINDTPPRFDEGVSVIVAHALEIAKGEKIEGVAGGIAGPLLEDKSGLSDARNLPDWSHKSLAAELRNRLAAPVFIENDTAIVGLGEAIVGAGKGNDIVAYLTVSTGVGGVRIVHGKIDENSRGFEPGHQIVVPGGEACPSCGLPGHLEGYISGKAFKSKYGMNPLEIADAKVWDDAARYLAYGVVNTIMYWSPDIVVIGGSMMKEHGINIDAVRKCSGENIRVISNLPKIVTGSLGDIGGLHGALLYLRQMVGMR